MFFSEKYVSEIFGGVGYPGTLGDTWIKPFSNSEIIAEITKKVEIQRTDMNQV